MHISKTALLLTVVVTALLVAALVSAFSVERPIRIGVLHSMTGTKLPAPS